MRWITRDREYYHSMITLAIPVMLQGLITFLVSFADNLMVNTLGDAAVSGVYMGSQIHTFIQLFTAGIGGAILILSAQYWGKRDTDHIRSIVSIGLRISLIVGFVFTGICLAIPARIIRIFTDDAVVVEQGAVYLRIVCLSYVFFCVTQALISAMRSVEVTRIGMTVSLFSLAVNIVLNYVLIFGKLGCPAMGIKGAAIATVCARVTETLIIVCYVFFRDDRLRFRLKDLMHRDGGLTRDFLKYGMPIVAGEIVWSVNMMCSSRVMGGYGAAVITAVSVVNMLSTLAFISLTGLASAVSIITGKTIGSGKYDLVKEYARTTQVVFIFVGLLTGLLLNAISGPFIGLYTGISAEASAEAKLLAPVLCICMMGSSYEYPCLTMVKAGGDTGFMFKNDAVFVFLVVLPSAFLAAHLGAPAWVTFACLKCDQVLKCIVAAVKVNSFKWIKDLTREAKF